jgi:hypothetical protein
VSRKVLHLTLILTGYEYYILPTGFEPDTMYVPRTLDSPIKALDFLGKLAWCVSTIFLSLHQGPGQMSHQPNP